MSKDKWKDLVDEPGEFRWIDKSKLGVDPRYQRLDIKQRTLRCMKHKWSWIACGCLIVALRPDGTLWVIDGQHRLLGARQRDDIQEMPCLVFNSTHVRQEAEGFYNTQTNRGAMSSIDSFRAEITAEHAVAQQVKAMVEASGYTVLKGQGRYTVACAKSLLAAMLLDPALCRFAWEISVKIADGEVIAEHIYRGLFYLEGSLRAKHDRTLLEHNYIENLVKAGKKAIQAKILVSVAYNGGGEKSFAEGIRNLINIRRPKSRQLPSVIA
jgi:hypothetical protein